VGTYSAKVVVLSRNTSKELESLPSSSMHFIQGDITKDAVAHDAINETLNKFGCLDSIVLNAGTLDPVSRLDQASASAWMECFNINLFSNVSLVTRSLSYNTDLQQIKESLPHLRASKGSVILISSGAATNAYSGWSAYSASKAALNSLAKSLAVEEPDITALAVRPGVVDTEMQNEIRTKRACL